MARLASSPTTARSGSGTSPTPPTPPRRSLTGHRPAGSAAFSPDGHTLAGGSTDGTIRLWSLDVEQAIDRICATSGNLTLQQWARYIPQLLRPGPTRHVDLRRDRRRSHRRSAARPGRQRRPARHGDRRRHGVGRDREQPGRRHRQACALRLGRAPRCRPSSWPSVVSPARRPSWTEGSACSARSWMAATIQRRSPASSVSAGKCRGSSSSPTRLTTLRTRGWG